MSLDLSRRAFLGGLAASAAATALPIPSGAAAAPVVPQVRTTVMPNHHPFLCLQKTNGPYSIVQHLRVRSFQTGDLPRLTICLERSMVGDTAPFSCMEDAEDVVLDRLIASPSEIADFGTDAEHPGWTSETDLLLCMILRNSNRIAAATRRGAGNTVLVSDSVGDFLSWELGKRNGTLNGPLFVNGIAPDGDKSVGRWRHRHRFAYHLTTDLFSSNAIPDDKMVILYKGAIGGYDQASVDENGERMVMETDGGVVFTGKHLSFNGGDDRPFESYFKVLTLRNFPSIPASMSP